MPLASYPTSVLGLRRLRLLQTLVRAKAPLSVTTIASRLGLGAVTTRAHLHLLLDAGLVRRVNYRRWAPIENFSLERFDAASLDALGR